MSIEAKIIDRIKKLLALARNNSNEHEARVAMEMAHKLLAKHNLTLSEMDAATAEREDPYTRGATAVKRDRPWMRTVAYAVAQLYFCEMYYQRSSLARETQFFFVGRETNVAIAKLVSEHVIATISSEMRRFSSNPTEQCSFHNGAAHRVRARCTELIKQARAGEVKSETGTALVLASVYDREQRAVKLYLQQHVPNLRTRASSMQTRDFNAYHAGQAAGSRVSLRPEVGASSRKAITGGGS